MRSGSASSDMIALVYRTYKSTAVSVVAAVLLLTANVSTAHAEEEIHEDTALAEIVPEEDLPDVHVNPEALVGFVQGEFALEMEDLDRAVMAFRRTTATHPEMAIGWLRLAETYRLRGEYGEALAALDRAEMKGAASWQIAMQRGETTASAGDSERALQIFSATKSLDAPSSFFVDWYRLAASSEDALAQRRAAFSYTQANPYDADAWALLGRVLRVQGYGESAIYPFQRAASLPDGSSDAAEEVVDLLLDMELPELATEQAAYCVTRYRDHVGCYLAQVDAQYMLAKAEMAHASEQTTGTGSFVETSTLQAAIEALARMTSATPRMFRRTGAELLRRTEEDIAIRYAETVVRFRPYNGSLREAAAWLVASTGNEEKALSMFEAYFAMDQSNASAMNYVGYTLAERGERLERAEELIRKALEIQEDDANIMDSLAWVLFKQGRYAEALEIQERVAEELPTNAVILDHLGDIYDAIGRRSDALAAWRQALEHATSDDEDVLETVPAKIGER